MDQFHNLLNRQLKRYIEKDALLPDSWHAFLDAINQAYIEFDTDRCILESALELSSQELFQKNEELRGILYALPDQLFRIDAENRVVPLIEGNPGTFHLSTKTINDTHLYRKSLSATQVLTAGKLEGGNNDLIFASHARAAGGTIDSPDGTFPGAAPGGSIHQFWEAVERARENQEMLIFEYERNVEGQEQCYEARLVPFVQSDILMLIRDITERKRAENALRVSEETARRALDDLLRVKQELEQEREKLHYLATRDSLTGVLNRRAIFDMLSLELARAEHKGHALAVIMMDIDYFKRINDTYGHTVGDLVLKEATQRLTSCIRTSDSLGRYGGEEFLIVLLDCDSYTAFSRAEQFRRAIESEPISDGTREVHITASFGVNWTRDCACDGDRLVQEADAALYRAKEAGRNRVEMASAPAVEGSLGQTEETSDVYTTLSFT